MASARSASLQFLLQVLFQQRHLPHVPQQAMSGCRGPDRQAADQQQLAGAFFQLPDAHRPAEGVMHSSAAALSKLPALTTASSAVSNL